jgi:hypothetical protein
MAAQKGNQRVENKNNTTELHPAPHTTRLWECIQYRYIHDNKTDTIFNFSSQFPEYTVLRPAVAGTPRWIVNAHRHSCPLNNPFSI